MSYCISMVMLLCVFMGANQQKQGGGLDVHLAASTNRNVVVGENITVRYRIINNAAEPISVIVTEPGRDYDLIVTNDKGKEIALTQYGRWLKDPMRPVKTNSVVEIAAGGVRDEKCDIDHMYEWGEGGVFHIIGMRRYYALSRNANAISEKKYDQVKSNEVVVEIARKK